MRLEDYLFLVEIGLLIWIVWQGELIRRYEKWTYDMNRERYDERKQWRESKRKQQINKGVREMPPTETSNGLSQKTAD